MSDLSQEEKSTNAETWEHINQVMRLLAVMQWHITKRMFTHDRSKLLPPEVSTFVEFTPKLKNSTYGSDEYKQFLADMEPALDHHYSHNRHHPEFFEGCQKDEKAIANCANLLKFLEYASHYPQLPDDSYGYSYTIDLVQERKAELESNVNGMNIIDLLEMIVDWKAATLRHADGDIQKSIEVNTKRFGLSPQIVSIIKNSVNLLDDELAHLKTQRDI